jgi:hypothetical protein
MDVGSRAPTVGALGDAGAIAERVGEGMQISFFLILTSPRQPLPALLYLINEKILKRSDFSTFAD